MPIDRTAFAIAQLRHLYQQMLSGDIGDTAAAARGLLGPAIEAIEFRESFGWPQPSPRWNYQLDGYVPQEGDWILHRSMPTVPMLVYKTDRERVYINGGYLLRARVIAYYRPPGPPPVPGEETK